ncbi:MAG: TIGR01777 family oxidoreductase [Hyphomicrobiaceae bacterium]
MTDTLLWTLVSLQVAMGAFDTLYHHEFTERLAWRKSQRQELRLHAVRNGFYGLIFLLLAWSEPRGWLALALLTVLLVEIGITLWDFVEEDLSRRLPATERVTHTLLALNYGAILVLLVPVLWAWSALPTALVATSHGWGSLFLTASAAGVVLFGLRDWLASARLGRLVIRPAAPLAAGLGTRKRILVTGATGFLGERLIEALAANGHDVVALVRSPTKAARLAAPITLITHFNQIPSDARLDAIVNLAGAPVADWPWTRVNRFRILHSRIKTMRGLLRLLDRLDKRPTVLVSASAIGWYGPRGDEVLTESDAAGEGFGTLSCRAVESEALRAVSRGVRVVTLRIGLVLDPSGGMLARLLPPFDLGAGGRIGHGRQWMSWITRDDLIRLLVHAMATPALTGAVNGTAPNPVRNAAFAKALGRALWRPAIMPLPAFLLRFLGREMAEEILLSGQRVLPAKALASGFVFAQPDLDAALGEMLGATCAPSQSSSEISSIAATEHLPITR